MEAGVGAEGVESKMCPKKRHQTVAVLGGLLQPREGLIGLGETHTPRIMFGFLCPGAILGAIGHEVKT